MSHSQAAQIERGALIPPYNSTDGANSRGDIGWLGKAGPECNWTGVTCTSGSVADLTFRRETLSVRVSRLNWVI